MFVKHCAPTIYSLPKRACITGKKRILFKSLYSSTGYKFSKIISQQGTRFLRKSVDLSPKIIMAICTSAIDSMTSIKTSAHILFQTSFSQGYVEIEKGYNSASKGKTTGRLIFISNSYMKLQNFSIFASSALCHP